MNSALIEIRAKDIINAATGWQIGNVADLPQPVKELVEKAISAQTDFINANGGLDYFTDNTNSMSLGSFSYTRVNSGAEAAGRTQPLLCRQAEMYLEQTGLMNRSVTAR
jgi:hypothetical protein